MKMASASRRLVQINGDGVYFSALCLSTPKKTRKSPEKAASSHAANWAYWTCAGREALKDTAEASPRPV
jgi:hypothetical protein